MIGAIETEMPMRGVHPHPALEFLHALDRLRIRAGVLPVAVGVDHHRVHAAELLGDRRRGDVVLVVGPEQEGARVRLADRRAGEDDVGGGAQDHERGPGHHVLADGVGHGPADPAHGADHEARQVVLRAGGRRQVADHHREQDLHGEDDADDPEGAEGGEVAHLRDRGDQDDQQTQHVGHDAEGAGHDQLRHRHRGRLDLRLVRVVELRRQKLVVLEEALGHLHGVGDGAGGDDHRDHQHQRVEGDPHPAREAEAPDRGGDGGGEGDQHAVEPAEVGEQEAEGGEHREQYEEPDLEGVLDDPAGVDRPAGDVDLVPRVLLDRLDPLDVLEDGLVDLAAGEPVGVEVGHDEGALLVTAHQAAEDVGRVLAHQVADLVGVLLCLRRPS